MSTLTPENMSTSPSNKRPKPSDESGLESPEKITRSDADAGKLPSDPEKSPESGVPEENQEEEEEVDDDEIDLTEGDDGSEYDFEMPSDVEEESSKPVMPTPMDRIKAHDPTSEKKPNSAYGFDKLCLAKKRLFRDFIAIKKESMMEGSAAPTANNILEWRGWLFGPTDTPFEDGSFFITLRFDEEYPFDPPQVWFRCKMFHPNIFADGEVSTRALKQLWSPASNVSGLLKLVYKLLNEPVASGPCVVNSEAGLLYHSNRQSYNSKIRACVKASLDQETDEFQADEDVEVTDTAEKEVEPEKGEFEMITSVPPYHKFFDKMKSPMPPQSVVDFVLKKDIPLLRSSLPAGIYVKAFEERLDMYSVMMRGPEKTPYQDFVFFFDVYLPPTYPSTAPKVHFHPPRLVGKTQASGSFGQRINPNLYDDGKVCLSLLGTWSGPGWQAGRSNMLQVVVSIQGLVMVEEPFYNEPGYAAGQKTGQYYNESRYYTENVVIRLAQCLPTMINDPPKTFQKEVHEHFKLRKCRLLDLLEGWCEISEARVAIQKSEGTLKADTQATPESEAKSDPLEDLMEMDWNGVDAMDWMYEDYFDGDLDEAMHPAFPSAGAGSQVKSFLGYLSSAFSSKSQQPTQDLTKVNAALNMAENQYLQAEKDVAEIKTLQGHTKTDTGSDLSSYIKSGRESLAETKALVAKGSLDASSVTKVKSALRKSHLVANMTKHVKIYATMMSAKTAADLNKLQASVTAKPPANPPQIANPAQSKYGGASALQNSASVQESQLKQFQEWKAAQYQLKFGGASAVPNPLKKATATPHYLLSQTGFYGPPGPPPPGPGPLPHIHKTLYSVHLAKAGITPSQLSASIQQAAAPPSQGQPAAPPQQQPPPAHQAGAAAPPQQQPAPPTQQKPHPPTQGAASGPASYMSSFAGAFMQGRRQGRGKGPTEEQTKALKQAAEQAKRPLPPFALLPIQARRNKDLRKAIDNFRQLLMKNDFNNRDDDGETK